MTVRRNRSACRSADAGFTLVELVIAIVLSGIIAGVITAALTTSLNVADSISEEVADSTDAGLITAFLYRDAQAAGATDPSTGQADARAGVSTSSSGSDWAGCGQDGTLVVRFSWPDPEQLRSANSVVVTYALDSAQTFTRRMCRDGTSVDLVLGRNIRSAVASCAPSPQCDDDTRSVTLTVVGSGTRAALTYSLTASLRNDPQEVPAAVDSAAVPLVALGSAAATPCPNLTVQGSGPYILRGDAVVAACGSSSIGGDANLLQPTGAVHTIPSVADPFIGVAPPAAACGGGGANPSPIGGSPGADATVVYPQAVVITGSVAFAPGRYVFCDGLDIGVGATVSGTDVFLFLPGGTLTVDDSATVQLSAAANGEYAHLLAWVATAQTVVLGQSSEGGSSAVPRVSTYAGHVYAPTSRVVVAGRAPTNIGGVIGQVVDLQAASAARFGLPIESIAVDPPVLPGGQVGMPYGATVLTPTGGAAPYTWTATGMPPGLTLDGSTGAVSGSPTSAGVFDVVVTVLDGTSTAASVEFQITVNEQLVISASPDLPGGQVAVAYPATAFSAAGGTAPFAWTATGLPAGLSIDSTSGVISGNPTAPGTATAVVTVTDAISATASRSATVTINPQLAVATTTLPQGQVAVGYPATTINASGGSAPITWSATGLPAGLTLSTSGVLSGTPTVSGSFTVIVTATDALAAQATGNLTLVVRPVLEQTANQLPGGQVGLAYPATTLTATGGTAPFTWSAEGLPAGLAIDPASGSVSGSPTAAGSTNVVVTVVDAAGAASTQEYAVTINARLAVAGPATLPSGQVGVPYPSTTLSSSGGTWAYSWSAIGLPAGLSIEPTTGVISGTPTAEGSFTVTATVRDTRAASAARTYTVAINPALTIATSSLPNGQEASSYPPTTLAAAGGTSPYTWSASGLPAGLVLAPATGEISGTPTVSGTHVVAVQVSDAAGATATASYQVVLASAIPPGCDQVASGWRGEYYGNASLSGSPALCRDDATIGFDWADGSADSRVPSDNFSVRWTRSQTFAAGDYIFSMGSDDGSRLYIDGVLVLDRWADHTYPNPVPTVTRTLAAGSHDIVMEYYERTGPARATLTWAPVVVDPCALSGNGWRAEYFSNISLSGTPTLCRIDPSIDFNWGSGSPATSIPSNNFSARWTRTVQFTAGTYEFKMGSDAGSRLYLDGVLVLDKWTDHSYPATLPSVTRSMTAGNHTIVMEYYERTGTARATLTWAEKVNGVRVEADTGGDQRYYGEHTLTLTNTSTITSMTVTIVVQRTLGLSAYGRYTTFASNATQSSQTSTSSTFVFTFTLKSGKTIAPGTWQIVAQTAGSGVLHPTTGDSWTVTTTANGVTITLTGQF